MFSLSYKKILLSSALLMAAAGSAWLATLGPKPIFLPKARSQPDAYMEQAITTIMNKEGKLNLSIASPKITHYPENNRAHLDLPTVILYQNSNQPWYITSNEAVTTQGIDKIDFLKNVVIHHAADLQNPATLVKTASLTVFPHEHFAKTADPITLIQPDLIVNATGMEANMNKGEINLLSAARGEYVPRN